MDELLKLPDDELGAIMSSAAAEAFPPTPDVAPVVRARMEREELAYPELRPRLASPDTAFAPPDVASRLRRNVLLALVALLLVGVVAAVIAFGVPGTGIRGLNGQPTSRPTPTHAAATAAPATQPADATRVAGSPTPITTSLPSPLGQGPGGGDEGS